MRTAAIDYETLSGIDGGGSLGPGSLRRFSLTRSWDRWTGWQSPNRSRRTADRAELGYMPQRGRGHRSDECVPVAAAPPGAAPGCPAVHEHPQLLGVDGPAHRRRHPDDPRTRQAAHELVRVGFAQWPAEVDDETLTHVRRKPQNLVVWSGRWCVVGFDGRTRRWRVLRVDRLRTLSESRVGFSPRHIPGNDVVAFIWFQNDGGDAPDHWPCVGKLTTGLPEYIFALPRHCAPARPGPLHSHRRARSWVGLAALARTFDSDFEPVESTELRRACEVLADRYARATNL